MLYSDTMLFLHIIDTLHVTHFLYGWVSITLCYLLLGLVLTPSHFSIGRSKKLFCFMPGWSCWVPTSLLLHWYRLQMLVSVMLKKCFSFMLWKTATINVKASIVRSLVPNKLQKILCQCSYPLRFIEESENIIKDQNYQMIHWNNSDTHQTIRERCYGSSLKNLQTILVFLSWKINKKYWDEIWNL